MGQGRGAVGRGHGAVDEALQLARSGPALTRMRIRSSDADDALQQVVEVVGDAAGELADRLHLLRLPQGLLGHPQLRGAHLDPGFQGGVESPQSRLGFGPFDHLTRTFRHLLDEGDLLGAPLAHPAVGEINDGAQPSGAQEWSHKQRASVEGRRHLPGLGFIVHGVRQQVGRHHGVARPSFAMMFTPRSAAGCSPSSGGAPSVQQIEKSQAVASWSRRP